MCIAYSKSKEQTAVPFETKKIHTTFDLQPVSVWATISHDLNMSTALLTV